MARRRLAVALMIPPPVSVEIDGLRRALGDRQLGRIDPHITLIPPINVHDDDLADALAVVDAAASAASSMDLTIGPVATFAEDSPVRFLSVDPWEPVASLYEACWTGVLDRERKRPFHPHVTIDIAGSPTDGPDPAVALLAEFVVEGRIDRVAVLEHPEAARHWDTYLSYRL